jgi:hypothetical protein
VNGGIAGVIRVSVPFRQYRSLVNWLTIFGVASLSFMMLMYGLERRGAGYILSFSVGCALSSAYGFASGAWPFGVVEALWFGVALRRYRNARVAT